MVGTEPNICGRQTLQYPAICHSIWRLQIYFRFKIRNLVIKNLFEKFIFFLLTFDVDSDEAFAGITGVNIEGEYFVEFGFVGKTAQLHFARIGHVNVYGAAQHVQAVLEYSYFVWT